MQELRSVKIVEITFILNFVKCLKIILYQGHLNMSRLSGEPYGFRKE